MNIPVPTYTLQDGSLVNPLKRWKKNQPRLLEMFAQVKEDRSFQGRRHSLELILSIVFLGLTASYTTIKDWVAFAKSRPDLLKDIHKPHGLPCETSISRVMDRVDIESLDDLTQLWLDMLPGWLPVEWAFFDGKTMRGVGIGKDVGAKHILSLISHKTSRLLGQEGVDSKENEIPAAQRLFARQSIVGLILIGDALHTQTKTAGLIIEQGADYLLFVKKNQKTLHQILEHTFKDPQTKINTATNRQVSSKRDITTTISVTQDVDLEDLRRDWKGLNWVGKIHRYGTRAEKGAIKIVDEVVYFIYSKEELEVKEVVRVIRDYWSVENKLHWQKDWTWLEDKQKLSRGKAPQVVTYLRSLVITLGHYLGVDSITDMVKKHQMYSKQQLSFLRAIAFS